MHPRRKFGVKEEHLFVSIRGSVLCTRDWRLSTGNRGSMGLNTRERVVHPRLMGFNFLYFETGLNTRERVVHPRLSGKRATAGTKSLNTRERVVHPRLPGADSHTSRTQSQYAGACCAPATADVVTLEAHVGLNTRERVVHPRPGCLPWEGRQHVSIRGSVLCTRDLMRQLRGNP